MRTVAFGAGLLLCLAASLHSWVLNKATGPNDAPAHIARYAAAVEAIPRGAIVIGYFSDRPYDTPLPSPPFIARYAFAPRMLVWFPDPAVTDWVVGDLSSSQDHTAAGEKLGLKIVRELGNGLVLYRRQ